VGFTSILFVPKPCHPEQSAFQRSEESAVAFSAFSAETTPNDGRIELMAES
jgi:hypothetical protein